MKLSRVLRSSTGWRDCAIGTPRREIAIRIDRIEEGNFGDYRSVGSGVSEIRVNVGQGYRIYYTVRSRTVVILLCGGDKSSQRRDIRRAQRMANEL